MKKIVLASVLVLALPGCGLIAETLRPGTEQVQNMIDKYCAAATQVEREAIRAEVNRGRENTIAITCAGDG